MQQYTSILLIVVMIIAFYFLIIRPQRKRSQQQQEMVRKLEPGARVVTTTGIYATIVAMGDKQVVLETSPGSRVTMLKQAVGRVVRDDEEDADLASYRGSGEPIAPPTESAGEQSGTAQYDQYALDQYAAGNTDAGSTSGMAGGSPVQEYAPGSAPDFTAGDEQEASEHETAPWPPQGTSEPGGPYASGGSVLGSSSLSAYDEQVRSREDADDGDPSAAQQDSDDKKQA